ncbi:HAD-IA family hydrolase [Actinoplanes sp. NBC_00393]|uniref:HAD-IA family hydrolase n=1 Tax=Actinoplanes sp. NBC_00393 TaxID=2975953 RepID=UPI002E1C5C90
MTASSSSRRRAVLIDVGGVLVDDDLDAAAAMWGSRLGMTAEDFLGAVFAGNDEQVLIGRVSEDAWWAIVAGRLRIGPDLVAAIRHDLAVRQIWDPALLACLRRVRARAAIAIVSNAWPGTRAGIASAGLDGLTDAVVLSCEVGWAKPDPRIFAATLDRLGVDAGQALFVDDTPGHVEAARSLGMAGHLHTGTGGTIERMETFVAAA